MELKQLFRFVYRRNLVTTLRSNFLHRIQVKLQYHH